jgi:hypothetical protein
LVDYYLASRKITKERESLKVEENSGRGLGWEAGRGWTWISPGCVFGFAFTNIQTAIQDA